MFSHVGMTAVTAPCTVVWSFCADLLEDLPYINIPLELTDHMDEGVRMEALYLAFLVIHKHRNRDCVMETSSASGLSMWKCACAASSLISCSLQPLFINPHGTSIHFLAFPKMQFHQSSAISIPHLHPPHLYSFPGSSSALDQNTSCPNSLGAGLWYQVGTNFFVGQL